MTKAVNSKGFTCKLRDNTTHSKGLITWAGLASSTEVTFIPVKSVSTHVTSVYSNLWGHEKNSGETVRRLGTIIQSIFCAQSGAGIRFAFLEIALRESVPRGSFTCTWKLSSRPFSRPDWLPLGLRGWTKASFEPPFLYRDSKQCALAEYYLLSCFSLGSFAGPPSKRGYPLLYVKWTSLIHFLSIQILSKVNEKQS